MTIIYFRKYEISFIYFFVRLKQDYQLISRNVPFIFQHFANETELLGRINENFAVSLREENLQQLFYEFYQPIHPTLRLM